MLNICDVYVLRIIKCFSTKCPVTFFGDLCISLWDPLKKKKKKCSNTDTA